MKRAFTLIELLVVIAIIAILAAILFPVFAQAKESAKKTATLAQYKQVGTAAQIYIADSDDVYMLSMGPNSATGGQRISAYAALPFGWTTSGGRDVEPRKTDESMAHFNALHPYIKNWNMISGTGLPTHDFGIAQSALSSQAPALVNLSMNGMLHAWSATAIANISKLPLFSPTMMKQNLRGLGLSSPLLNCRTDTYACRFNPTGHPAGTPGQIYGGGGTDAMYAYAWYGVGNPGYFTLWQYGRGMSFVSADTSARFFNFNAPTWPLYAENVNSSPWSSFDPAGPPGSPYWMTDCVAPGATKGTMPFYPGYYRPDSEYNYTLAQCDFGGG
jgi:prepilin-type N-terminal cleavage/methylation domain-containing protein